jgi:nucleoside-diphosphate-sugar epimerase
MNVLIIGGSGFLGLHLLNNLQESQPSANIYISSSREEAANENVLFVNYEIFESVASLFLRTKPDYIFHLASNCVRDCSDNSLKKGQLRDDNILKALSVLELSSKFIFVSSMAVFSMSDKEVTPMKYHPESNYGLEKLYMINKLLDFSVGNKKVKWKVVYPSSIYGKGQNGKMFLPRLLEHIEQERLMVAFGGNKKRDFVHVKDVSRMLVKLVLDFDTILHKHIFVNSFVLYKISEIADLVCSILQLDPKKVVRFDDSQEDVEKHSLDFQTILEIDCFCYEFAESVSLLEGLQEMFGDVGQIIGQ